MASPSAFSHGSVKRRLPGWAASRQGWLALRYILVYLVSESYKKRGLNLVSWFGFKRHAQIPWSCLEGGTVVCYVGVLCLYLLAYLRPLGTDILKKAGILRAQRVNSHLTSTSLKTTWLWCALYSGWSLLGASNFANRSNRWLPFVLVVFVIRGALANAIYPIDRSILMDIRWEG